jgi:GH24 family phage-related lysozyme (muramidase)
MNRTLIEQLITRHEGTRLSVYKDSKGNLTIGIGFNLDSGDAARICGMFGINYNAVSSGAVSLTQEQVDDIFEYQLNMVIGQAIQTFPNFATMPDNVQAVICDQIFNMGLPKFKGFVNEIAALKSGNWQAAAAAAKDSDWFGEVGTRGTDDVALLEEA